MTKQEIIEWFHKHPEIQVGRVTNRTFYEGCDGEPTTSSSITFGGIEDALKSIYPIVYIGLGEHCIVPVSVINYLNPQYLYFTDRSTITINMEGGTDITQSLQGSIDPHLYTTREKRLCYFITNNPIICEHPGLKGLDIHIIPDTQLARDLFL